MVVVALGGLALGGFERWTRAGRYDARCRANLGAIGLALQAYHADHGSYPPAFVADASGRPIHSWRALLLPYLGEPGLAGAYRRDEPWDGPHNARLADRVPDVYQCPAHGGAGEASYAAIVGPGTAWPGTVGVAAAQVADGSAIHAVELEGGVPWLAPRDLTIGAADPGLDPEQARVAANRDLADLRRQGMAVTRHHPRGMNWLMTPLRVDSLRYGANSGLVFRYGLTIAGGEVYCIEVY